MNNTAIEDVLALKVKEITEILAGKDVYFQEAGAKFIVRELCWALVSSDPQAISHGDLSDHLDVMSENMREHRG